MSLALAEQPIEQRPVISYEGRAWRVLATPDDVTIWQWQCDHGMIPASESGRPGRWDPRQGRIFKKALDLIHARLTGREMEGEPQAGQVRTVIICGPSQIGKTKSFLHPIISWAIDTLQGNIAFLTHKQRQIRAHVKTRLLPMLNATPRLARYMPQDEHEKRTKLNHALLQLGPVNLHCLCANVASDLREYSHQLGVGDEIEAWALDADGEGSPLELFLDRQKRYPHDSCFGAASTPNDIAGHTWHQLCSGSHERLMLRCSICGCDQDLDPSRLFAADPEAGPEEIERRDLGRWQCINCEHGHDSAAVDAMVADALERDAWLPGTWEQNEQHPAGHWDPGTEWRVDAEGVRHRVEIAEWQPMRDGELAKGHLLRREPCGLSLRTFHCNYLHSPDCSLGRFLAHELKADIAGNAQQVHTHTTGWRAEPIISAGSSLDLDQIEAAVVDGAHRWGSCSHEAVALVLITDQQGNSTRTSWFPWSVWAIVPEAGTFTAYLVEAGRADGFPALEQVEARDWPVGNGRLGIARTFVDGANGNMAPPLRRWCDKSYREQLAQGYSPDEAKAKAKRILLVGDAGLPEDLPWREQRPSSRSKQHHPPGVTIIRWNKTHWCDIAAARLADSPDQPRLVLPAFEDGTPPPTAMRQLLKSLTSEEPVMERRGRGANERYMRVWRPRVHINTKGDPVERTDTHYWDDVTMLGVACDLLGVYDPGQSAINREAARQAARAPERCQVVRRSKKGVSRRPGRVRRRQR